jgi:L-amino acid N-acyltransferase YncA
VRNAAGPPVVRPAQAGDLSPLAAIYAHFVRTSVATFDVREPPMSYWRAKLERTDMRDRLLVACDGDELIGFAYSGAFRSRPAYERTRETSVYVAPGETGKGVGTRLYGDLLGLLTQNGVHLVVAVVAQPNPASNALHRSLGFTEAGTLAEVGRKFGAYVSTTWFQLLLT